MAHFTANDDDEEEYDNENNDGNDNVDDGEHDDVVEYRKPYEFWKWRHIHVPVHLRHTN